MISRLLTYFNLAIICCYCLLFFLIPLILTPWNYELFEYNKMMATYGITVIIAAMWISTMVLQRRIIIPKTPLDVPILLFLASQIGSTIFSIDPHVSWWGYYSRFNGGLLSTITYIVLYYAFVSAFRATPNQAKPIFSKIYILRFHLLFLSILFSGLLVSLYGILEHFGIDKHLWIQDVMNRVFSTLGQPNWLAAYEVVLLSIGLGLFIYFTEKLFGQLDFDKLRQFKAWLLLFVQWFTAMLIPIIFYITLLFTKSRSGFLAFLAVFGFFVIYLFFTLRKRGFLPVSAVFFVFFILTIIIGTPFSGANDHLYRVPLFKTVQTIFHPQPEVPPEQIKGTSLETGGTESGEIRKIVWSGAIDIVRHNPLFGTGVETFAFSYYKFRPARHNLTSEWDFLYNKAHNEFLNYAATTGLFGLGTYLLFIASFILWSIKNVKTQIVHLSFFIGWLSILITNFFGFSVVPLALFFWLIPAFVVSTIQSMYPADQSFKGESFKTTEEFRVTPLQASTLVIILLTTLSLLYYLYQLWLADVAFAQGYNLGKAGRYTEAYPYFRQALTKNYEEPFYHDEFAGTLAPLARLAWETKEASLAGELADLAIAANNKALSISPNNVSFWKTRARVFITLLDLDAKYAQEALAALDRSSALAPTDSKIIYNKALLLSRMEKKDASIEELKKTIELKPNYKDPRFALSLYYQERGKKAEAREELEYILTKIDPNDQEVKEVLKELDK